MKKQISIIVFILILFGDLATAENFSYDYVGVQLATTDSDATEKEIYLLASKSINNNISLRGGLYYYAGDWTTSNKSKEQIGKGFYIDSVFNVGITSTTDFVVSTGYSYFSAESICTPISGVCTSSSNATNDTNIYSATIGIKQKLTDSIEIEAHYRGIEFEEGTSSVTQGNLILMDRLSDNISFGIDYSWNITRNDFNRSGLFIRREF
jgi:hypothetical protein